jgi:hypothetical protein
MSESNDVQQFEVGDPDVFQDYTCPICGTVTSKHCTKLKCDCHKRIGVTVHFNGIVNFPVEFPASLPASNPIGALAEGMMV